MISVEVHTHLLTKHWAELVLLSACFYATLNSSANKDSPSVSSTTLEGSHHDVEQVSLSNAEANLHLLQVIFL